MCVGEWGREAASFPLYFLPSDCHPSLAQQARCEGSIRRAVLTMCTICIVFILHLFLQTPNFQFSSRNCLSSRTNTFPKTLSQTADCLLPTAYFFSNSHRGKIKHCCHTLETTSNYHEIPNEFFKSACLFCFISTELIDFFLR